MPDFNKERVAVTTGPVFLLFYLSLFANYDAFPTRIRAANQFVTGDHDCVSLSGANASAACCALLELAVIAAMSKNGEGGKCDKMSGNRGLVGHDVNLAFLFRLAMVPENSDK